jgi:hypothetical protein
MPHEPMQDEPLREAMEAYRPGTDDPGDPHFAALVRQLAADPELAERVEELRRLDGVIRGAMQDVPVPEALAQRLLRRLEEARSENETGGLCADTNLQAPPDGWVPSGAGWGTFERSASPLRRRVPYRVRWMVSLAGAVAAALVVAIWLRANRTQVFTPSAVLEAATRMFAAEPPEPAYLLAEKPAPPDYPFGHDVLEMPETRWRWVAGFLGGKAVAYDLMGPGGCRATLYVARRTVDQLPSLPPDAPRPMTAGCSAAAWQQESLLYVLVVDGDARVYRNFLDHSRGPLT